MTAQNLYSAATLKSRFVAAIGTAIVGAAVWIGLGGSMGAAPVPDDPMTCLPTCAIDGRSLVMAGDDPSTLGGVIITIGLNFTQANSPVGNFELFDGDGDISNWDVE